MKAAVGDQLIVHGVHVDDAAREGEILEVHGADGGPPYVVRWSDNGHETLFFPGPDATVHHFAHDGPTVYSMQTADLETQVTAVVRGHIADEEIRDFLSTAFTEVARAVQEADVAPTGPPFARFHNAHRGFDIEAGFPVTEPTQPPTYSRHVARSALPEGRVVRTMHVGEYGAVGMAHEALAEWVLDNGYVATGAPWECYLDGPNVGKARTVVYQPYAQPGGAPC